MLSKSKLFDIDDLSEKRDWLECLSGYIEWEYSLDYQRGIDGVIHLLNEMIKKECPSDERKGVKSSD